MNTTDSRYDSASRPAPRAPRLPAAVTAIIFDLDDTLYLEIDYVLSGFRAVARWLASRVPGIPADSIQKAADGFDRELWRAFGRDRNRAFDLMADDLKLGAPEKRPELVREMLSIYRVHDPDIQLCDDARAVLPQLAGRYRLGLISDGDPDRQWRKLVKLGLDRLFTGLILTGANPEWTKPCATPFRLIGAQLKCLPAECVYVADNPAKDFVGPRRVGMRCIRVRRAGGLYESARCPAHGEPDLTITSLSDLPAQLAGLETRRTPARPEPRPADRNRGQLTPFPQRKKGSVSPFLSGLTPDLQES